MQTIAKAEISPRCLKRLFAPASISRRAPPSSAQPQAEASLRPAASNGFCIHGDPAAHRHPRRSLRQKLRPAASNSSSRPRSSPAAHRPRHSLRQKPPSAPPPQTASAAAVISRRPPPSSAQPQEEASLRPATSNGFRIRSDLPPRAVLGSASGRSPALPPQTAFASTAIPPHAILGSASGRSFTPPRRLKRLSRPQ